MGKLNKEKTYGRYDEKYVEPKYICRFQSGLKHIA